MKRRREHLGLTQDELAQKVRVRRPTISELENHRRKTVSSEVLRRLALALSCTADYLLGMYADEDEGSELEPAGAASGYSPEALELSNLEAPRKQTTHTRASSTRATHGTEKV